MTATPLENWWRKCAPYWHVSFAILSALAYAAFWFHDVDGAKAQTGVNTADIAVLKQTLAVMQEEQSDMKNELHAVWQVIVGKKNGR